MKETKKLFLDTIAKHKLIIFKIANIYCSDNADKKDLSQEIIMKLWENFDRYDQSYKLSTWVYQVALNVAISYKRKDKTRRKYHTSFDNSIIHISIDSELCKMDEASLKLTKLIHELNAIEKAIITLHLDGYSHAHISKMTGLSTTNVGTKISRIKKQLIQQFKSTYDGE